MTHEWKVGDKIVVVIGNVSPYGDLGIAIDRHGIPCWIKPHMAEPLPPGITPEAQTVLDWVVEEWGSYVGPGRPLPVRAYLDSLTPPDPIAELIAACQEIEDRGLFANGDPLKHRLLGAIKAVEAAERSRAK